MPFLPLEKLDLLMGGAVQERFRIALAEVLANIRDPNTRATEKRSITLTITLAPYATRDTAQMDFAVKTKLAAATPAETTVYLAYSDDGLVTASEKVDQIPGQIDMDGREAPTPNIVTFETKKP